MDQLKIGRFIAQCRKGCGLTQMQLAEKLNITDRAVSKWETGKAMPDSSIMLELCHVLRITVNDLLNGEIVTMSDYNEKTEKLLLEMAKQKEASDKRLLAMEIVIGVLSMIILLGFCVLAAYLTMPDWLRATLIVAAFVLSMPGLFYALRLEQVAGYYECGKCGHRYVPTYQNMLWAMHFGRTRYMKCPHCGKRSWQKKVITKE